MAVTPFKTFVSGEILTASDLNNSFTKITDNGQTIGFPRTQAADFDGEQLILDSDGDTHIRADTDDQIDIQLGGVDAIVLTAAAMFINGARVVTEPLPPGLAAPLAVARSAEYRAAYLEQQWQYAEVYGY